MTTEKEITTVQDAMRSLRKEMDLTQSELGRRLGRELNSIQRYESNGPPQGAILVQLATMALDNERYDLAKVFQNALLRDLGPNARRIIGWEESGEEFNEIPPELSHYIRGLTNMFKKAKSQNPEESTYVLRIVRSALEPYVE